MASELERKRAQVAQLQNEVGHYGLPEALDLAPYKRKVMSLRAEKDHLLAREKEKLTREYEHRLAMERAILHDRLQKELQFRMRQDLTTASSKNKAYGGLLNPPRFGGDHAPKTEAYMKARNEFKCVSEDTIPGYVVTRVLGAVSGSAYITGQPEPELENVDTSRSDRAAAVNQLTDIAIGRGANAVIGLRFDTSAPLGSSHIEVLAYGTAVNIKRDNGKGQNQGWDHNNKQVSFKDESLQELLKRVLAEEEGGGGGKKKNKQQQPPEPAEDEVTFSQIAAVMALLNGKGGGASGGNNNNSGFSGWGNGGGGGGGTSSAWDANNSGGWGAATTGGGKDSGWGAGGGTSSNAGGGNGWGAAGGAGSGGASSWNAGNKTGGGDWDASANNDSWGASNGSGGDYNNNNADWGAGGGGGGGYGGNDWENNGDENDGPGGWNSGYDRRGGRGRGSPGIDIDPREMALFMSDMLKKMRPRSRREDSRSERPSPIFAWEAT